jgi:ATP-dependent Clp protease ATP-binding subunit ClpX
MRFMILLLIKAIEFKLGARGLRSICELIMLDAMYNAPSSGGKKGVHITLDYAHSQIKFE